MRHRRPSRYTLALLRTTLSCALATVASCDGAAPRPREAVDEPSAPDPRESAEAREAAREAERRAREQERIERDYPLHGLVTAPQLFVREGPSADTDVIGWLRWGARLRLKREPVRARRCATGWYEVYPRGHACAGQGIEVGETPPSSEAAEGAADTAADALPYRYFRVREERVPEYHRLPSRQEQQAAGELRDRYVELLERGDSRRAQQLLEGTLRGEPAMPAVVARLLTRGFWVASNFAEVRTERRFVRTARGSFVQQGQLARLRGSEGFGVELDETTTLPIAWASRTMRPLRREQTADGSLRLVEDEAMPAWERQQRVPWLRRDRFGTERYNVLAGPGGEERLARLWFVSVAEAIEPPAGVGDDEPWVHVDVGEQTLVAYRGRRPVFATLVSTGLDGHDTPRGVFTIRRKLVSETMADLGPEAGDDSYRIEDVPWTLYFDGSFALHGAFWHDRFGLRRSHGCVNMSPRDARWVFDHTWPEIPQGWHGVSTERTEIRGSRVVVTD
jgi:hypothetical protein